MVKPTRDAWRRYVHLEFTACGQRGMQSAWDRDRPEDRYANGRFRTDELAKVTCALCRAQEREGWRRLDEFDRWYERECQTNPVWKASAAYKEKHAECLAAFRVGDDARWLRLGEEAARLREVWLDLLAEQERVQALTKAEQEHARALAVRRDHPTAPRTAVDILWRYIEERERIRLRRGKGEPFPWTADPILRDYKFTNVRRLHDRTTQAFLSVYKSRAKSPAPVALYNCGVYRLFGTADFAAAAGWLPRHDLDALLAAAEECKRRGGKVHTGAYMVRADGALPKVESNGGYLAGLWRAAPDITAAIQKERRWEAGYRVLRRVRGFGPSGDGFMAKEVLQDFLLWLPFEVKDAATWTPVGPGARRGVNRLLGRALKAKASEDWYVGAVCALLEQIQPRWARAFPRTAPLTAHDVQFCLCELDKYIRAKNGEGRPRSRYRPARAVHLARAG